jgi:hypothetical protein
VLLQRQSGFLQLESTIVPFGGFSAAAIQIQTGVLQGQEHFNESFRISSF